MVGDLEKKVTIFRVKKYQCRECICLVLTGILAACAPSKTGPKGVFVISTLRAAFYKNGPAQRFGPDLQLPKGQRITKLESRYGFSHVMTADGTTGYVLNEDITPAPPEVTAPGEMARSPSPRSGSRSQDEGRAKRNLPERAMPFLDVNDVPLPTPDKYEPPTATPKFRF